MDVPYLFAGIGAIILLGFLGSLLFERTKIPDILILIFIGLLLGPVMIEYFGYEAIPSATLSTIAPYFAALALVTILFDGGLNLNLEKTMKKLGLAILHTGIAFVGTMFITAFISFYLLSMDIFVGLLLGSILGGVSSAVVIPILYGSSASEESKILLTLESVLTDVLCIVTALVLIEILKGGNADAGQLIQQLLSAFVLAGFIAFLFGIVWLMVLKKLEGKPFSFMITIAALLLLYAAAEYIQVSGAIAALVFGLVLSNKDEIARMLKIRGSFMFDEHIRQFHSEVSFLVRTFFFVYLGMTFSFTIGSGSFGNVAWFIPPWISGQPLLLFAFFLGVVFLGILVVRYIAASVTCAVSKDLKPDKSYIYAMLPRGLAAAVLAQLPFTIAEFREPATYGTEHYVAMIEPYQSLFLNMAFMMIVLTVLATTIGISVIEHRRSSSDGENEETEPVKDDWAAKSPMYRKHLESGGTLHHSTATGPGTAPASKPRVIPRKREPAPPRPPKAPPSRSTRLMGAVEGRDQHPLVRRAAAAQRSPPPPPPVKKPAPRRIIRKEKK